MFAILPSWFDLDALKYSSAGVTVALVLAAVGALVWVRKAALRVWVVLLLVGLAGGAFYYRTTLDDCEKTCSCKFINDRVKTDGCPDINVDEDRQNEFD